MRPLLVLIATCALAAGGSAVELPSQAVLDDWRQHDASQLRELVEPGVLRFPGSEIQWPGLPKRGGDEVPLADGAPILDGVLDDACWGSALTIPPVAPHEPTYRLCHDTDRLFIAAELPGAVAAMYRGELTAMDAGGAVDGVKDGRYGFHTGGDPNPWWQVDLGAPVALDRIVIYNRLDYAPGLNNANKLRVLRSVDGETWSLDHDQPNRFFGGMDEVGPLVVDLRGAEGRYLHLQIPSDAGILYHLDEVEVYGVAQPELNIALGRPASQSSLSIWSRGGPGGAHLVEYGGLLLDLVDGQMLANGAPWPDAAVVIQDGTLRVEISVPVTGAQGTHPGAIRLGGLAARPMALGAEWAIEWDAAPQPAFGRSTLRGRLRSRGPLAEPLSLRAEVIALTRTGICREWAGKAKVASDGPFELPVTVRREGPVAIAITVDEGGARYEDSWAAFVPPVRETLRRAKRILLDDRRARDPGFRALERRAAELEERELNGGARPEEREALYLQARTWARAIALSSQAMDFDELLFVKRHTQQTYPDVCLNHMPWVSRPGGDLFVLSPVAPEGQVRPVLDGQLGPGHVHGMDLNWDGRRVVFAYAHSESEEPHPLWLDRTASYGLRKTVEPIHLFEIGVDGSGLRQLTDGEWSDLDPCYLPNDEIAFVSERCGFSLQCNELDKDETSCNLYLRRSDGSIRRMSVTKDGDYLPHVLDNGLLGYTRWEYQERNWAQIQSLWVIRPDGTAADAVFKQHFNDPWAVEEVRSIPDSLRYVGIATGHHTLPVGSLLIIEPNRGINNVEGIRIVSPGVVSPEGPMAGFVVDEGGIRGKGGLYGNPWPLTESAFLVTYTYSDVMIDERGYALYLADVHGTRELIYRDPDISCVYPIPLRPRPRPVQIADATELDKDYATCVVSSIYDAMPEVEPGAIKYLRISQRMAWPYTIEEGGFRYEPDVKSVMINWTPARVIGAVPVLEDGSAHFRVPVDTPVYFQALDAEMKEVRRMRSFISFQPGEKRGCVGCHETQARAPVNAAFPMAASLPPSPLAPGPFGDEPVSFLRDIQPILDRNCISCHSGLSPEAGLNLSGGLTNTNVAWDSIHAAGLVSRSNVGEDSRITEPYAFGSTQSRIVEVLETTHRDRVRLSEAEWRSLITWIDLNAPYHGRFINKRPAVEPYDLTGDTALRQLVTEVSARRCADCHDAAQVSGAEWIDLRDASKAGFLRAPLARSAGGSEVCGRAVYETRGDPDYRRVLAAVEAALEEVWARPRRDVATLSAGGQNQ